MPVLTSIRFLAAFWVALYHYKKEIVPLLPISWHPIATVFLELGACGVSLFFVLSGFILTYTYWDRDITTPGGLKSFFIHRFARIYPMYLVSILLVVPILFVLPDAGQVEYTRNHPWLVGLSHLTLTHNWFIEPIQAFNAPTWSVGCEVGFYLAFPFLLPRIIGLTAHKAARGIVFVFALSAVFPLLYSRSAFAIGAALLGLPYASEFDKHLSLSIQMWSLFRIGEFIIGMLIGVLVLRVTRWSDRRRRVVAWGAAAGLALFALSTALPIQRYVIVIHQVAPVPFFAAVILLAVLAGGERPRWLAAPWLILLGEASYSFYLIHIPVKHGLRIALARFGVEMTGAFGIVLSLLITGGASILALRLIEAPARRFIVARFGTQPAPQVAPTVPKI